MMKNTLLYGFKTWKITKKNKRKIEMVEMDIFREG